MIIYIAKRSLYRNPKRQRNWKHSMHKWRGHHESITLERTIIWTKKERSSPELISSESSNLDRYFIGGGVKMNKNRVYTDLSPRKSVLGILWRTDTGISFLLERSSPHSYTAHLHKGLVFFAKAELLLRLRFKWTQIGIFIGFILLISV